MTPAILETANTVNARPVKFLIVDDDQVSVMGIKRVLKRQRILNPVVVAKDGKHALDILRGDCGEDKLVSPYLVTLDLNMPRMNGFEFLEAVRQDPRLHRVVVFVLSTSDAPTDVAAAYESNIAGYIVKDALGESLPKALRMINAYSEIVQLPE